MSPHSPPSFALLASALPTPPSRLLCQVSLLHAGWMYLAVQTTAPIAPGEELLLSYGEDHWTNMRALAARVAHLGATHRHLTSTATPPYRRLCARLHAAAAGLSQMRADRLARAAAIRQLCEEDARADRSRQAGGSRGAFGAVAVSYEALRDPRSLHVALREGMDALRTEQPFDTQRGDGDDGGGGGDGDGPRATAMGKQRGQSSTTMATAPQPAPPPRVLLACPNTDGRSRPFAVGVPVYGPQPAARAPLADPAAARDAMPNLESLPRTVAAPWPASLLAPLRGALVPWPSRSPRSQPPMPPPHAGLWWSRPHAMRYSCAWELADRPRRCALLLDDCQEAYRALMPAGYLRRLVRLLDAARDRGVLVVWSCWCRTGPNDGHYGALDEFYGPYGVRSGENALYLHDGAAGERLLSEVAPQGASERQRVLRSTRFDCFACRDEAGGSALQGLLEAHGVCTLLLAGCWTESCILSTALRAVNEDFNTCVVEDAVFTGLAAGPAAHEVLRQYVLPATAEEVVHYLRCEATATLPNVELEEGATYR